MDPVEVGLDVPGWVSRTWARDQPEYRPLPSLVSARGTVVSRWRLTEEERAAVARGEDVFLCVYTFGGRLQPVLPAVGAPMDVLREES